MHRRPRAGFAVPHFNDARVVEFNDPQVVKGARGGSFDDPVVVKGAAARRSAEAATGTVSSRRRR